MTTYTPLPSGIYVLGTTESADLILPAGGTRWRMYVDMGLIVALVVTVMLRESFDAGVTWREVTGFTSSIVIGNVLPAVEMSSDGSARRVRVLYTVGGLATSAVKLDVT